MITVPRHLAIDRMRSLRATFLGTLVALMISSCADEPLPIAPDPSDIDTVEQGAYDLKNIQISLVDLNAVVRCRIITATGKYYSEETTRRREPLSRFFNEDIIWDSCTTGSDRALFIRDVRPVAGERQLDSCEVFRQGGYPYLRVTSRWLKSTYTATTSNFMRTVTLTLGPLRSLDSLTPQQVMVFNADEIKQRATVLFDYYSDIAGETRPGSGSFMTRENASLDSLDILPTAEIRVTLTR